MCILANENLQAAMKTRNVNYDFLKKNAQVQYCSTKGREKSQAHNNEKNNRKITKMHKNIFFLQSQCTVQRIFFLPFFFLVVF